MGCPQHRIRFVYDFRRFHVVPITTHCLPPPGIQYSQTRQGRTISLRNRYEIVRFRYEIVPKSYEIVRFRYEIVMKSYDFVRFGRVHPKIVYDIVRFACKSYMIRQGSQASQPGQPGQPARASQARPGQPGHQDARTTFAGCAPLWCGPVAAARS